MYCWKKGQRNTKIFFVIRNKIIVSMLFFTRISKSSVWRAIAVLRKMCIQIVKYLYLLLCKHSITYLFTCWDFIAQSSSSVDFSVESRLCDITDSPGMTNMVRFVLPLFVLSIFLVSCVTDRTDKESINTSKLF